MQAGILNVVVARDAADGNHAADVLDGRCECYRDHEQNGANVEFGRDEVGYRQPGRRGDSAGVDYAKGEGQPIADRNASKNWHQAEQALTQHGHQQCSDQGGHGDEHRCLVGDQLRTAVACLAHGHVDCHRREGQANGDDHWGDDYRRQQSIDEPRALQPYCKAEQDVDEACRYHAAHDGG